MAKKPKLITPVGDVKFPFIENPDQNGKYSITLVFDPKSEEFTKLIAEIDECEKDFEKKYRGKAHYKKNIDIVDGEKVETEKVSMNFKSIYPMWDEKGTKIFDAKGNPMKEDIGWGSKVRVAFVLSPYDQAGHVGVTRYIAGIQVVDLKQQGSSAEACGFTPVEGYVHEEKPQLSDEEKQKMIDANEIAWDE
jgi:hypothetical protein